MRIYVEQVILNCPAMWVAGQLPKGHRRWMSAEPASGGEQRCCDKQPGRW